MTAVMAAPGSRTVLAGRHIRGEMGEQPDVLGNLARHVAHFAGQSAALAAQAGAFDEVVFLAGGSSEHAALLGRHAVEARCGIPARVLTPVDPQQAERLTREADRRRLAVVLSPSGADPAVLALADRYAASGAALIAVTNDARCLLARSAALCVDLAAGLELAASPTKSTTSQMLAVLAIAEGLPAGEGVRTGLGDAPSAKALAPLIAELLADTAAADAVAARLVGARRVAVVGCDHHFPAALETARMLRDTAGLTVEGFSADGLRTGPVGGFDAETTAVLLAGESDEQVRELRAHLRARGVPLVGIGTAGGTDEPDLAFPALGTMAECILATVRGQQLAVAAAVARGLDPDRPVRGNSSGNGC